MKHRSSQHRRFFLHAAGALSLGAGWAALQLAGGGIEPAGFPVSRPAAAGEYGDFAQEEAAAQEEGDGRTVRLNFFNSTWPSILRKVAQETGSELVMQRAPSGRWTRADRQRYSRTDAVRVLNVEMEKKGFRLLEQGKFLVVLHLDTLRTRYERPTVPRTEPEAARPVERTAGSSDPPDMAHTIAGRNDDFQPPVVVSDDEAEAGDSAAPPPSQSPQPRVLLSPVVVPTRQRGAKAVAQVMYAALKDRAELIDDGPGNLPAFRVYRKQPEGKTASASPAAQAGEVQFAVGIDVERQELVVAGTRDQQQNVARTIRAIDDAHSGPGEVIRLAATEKDAGKMAEHLRPALKQMLAQGPRGRRQELIFQQQPLDDDRDADDDADEEQQQPRGPERRNQPNANQPPGAQDPGLRLEGLKGPVSIQETPFGMVISGHPDDVEIVVRLIGELERLAAGRVAKLELLNLKHVNSEALADLLTTIYSQLTAIRGSVTGQRPEVAIIPVVKPNAIIIIAAEKELVEVGELAIRLDEPVDPRSEFQVFALKSAIATQVVEQLNELYEQQQQQQQTNGLRPRIRAIADVRTNSVIVQAAPRDLAEVALLIRKIDRDSSEAVSKIQVFPLKNAIADELAEVIDTAIQSVLNPAQTTGVGQVGAAGGQATQQLRDAKSVVLEFLTADGTARRLIRSGILADIRVTADPRVNSLIVTAPEQSMSLMAELIRQLDQPTTTVAEIKVFTLTNSDAAAMARLLETLFASTDAQAQLGVQVAGAEDASSGLIPLRFSVDTRTNTIIAIGGAEALRVVQAILLRLDQTDVRQRRNVVIKLKNSPAQAVADAINQFLQSQRNLAQIDPELVSNIELLEQEIIVVPELVSNSLLVSATPRYYQEVLNIIQQLDEAPPQVIIQVLIVEVDLQNTDEFGVELGFQDSLLFDRGLLNLDNFRTITQTVSNPATGIATTTEQIVNQETQPGFLFNNQQLGNNTAIRPASVGTQGLSNFSLGRVNGDLGFGGLVMSASSESISVLVRALASQRNLHVLSRPQIRTVDNQLATIQVGQQVPVITGAVTNQQGGVTPIIGAPQQVGISLQVTPRITPDGIVVMETIANKSAIAGQGVPFLSDPTTGAVIESPIFDLTEARATIAVPDGQTVVLGGMITKTDDTIERKVPWLGDVPLLGSLFRFDSTRSRRTELIIFMTPRIIRNAADSELIKQVEAERLHFLEDVAEEVHGPLFAVPPPAPFDEFDGMFPLDPEECLFPPGPGGAPLDGYDVPTTIMPDGAVPLMPGYGLPAYPGDEFPAMPGSPPPIMFPPSTMPPPPATDPSSEYAPIPPGMPLGANEVGRQSVRSADTQTVRGAQPKRKSWMPRLPFRSK